MPFGRSCSERNGAYRKMNFQADPAESPVMGEFFFEQHRRYVISLLRQCGLPETSHEDCAQEVWLEVVRRLPGFRARRQPRAVLKWLALITRAKVADWHRRERRRHRLQIVRASQPTASDDPAAQASRREQAQFIHRGLTDLRSVVSASTYFVVEKRCLEGHSVQDVCQWTGKKPQHVWDRQRRGLKKLKAILRDLAMEI